MKIRCSSLPRVAKCPASFLRCALATKQFGGEQENEAMARGKEIHDTMARIVRSEGLKGLQLAKDDLNHDIAVRILAMRAWKTITLLGVQNASGVYVEHRLPSRDGESSLPDGMDIEGTSDLVICDENTNRMLVLDYKSGMAAQEPAYEHPQLVAYAILAYFSADSLFPTQLKSDLPLTVFGQIVPAAGKMWEPLRIDKDNGSDAMLQMISIIRDAQDEHMHPEPGPHCVWCYAAGKTCEAFKDTVSEALVAPGVVLPSVADHSLASAFEMVKRLAAMQDSIATELKRRITSTGKPCGGYGLKLRRGTVKLEGMALLEVCAEYGITATDLGLSVNIKDIGDIVAKKLMVKKVDGLSLVEAKYGMKAVHNEGSMLLERVDEDEE